MEIPSILGKPIGFWIKVKAVLDAHEIYSEVQLDKLIDYVNSEGEMFDQAAKQLGGQVGPVPPINSNKEE